MDSETDWTLWNAAVQQARESLGDQAQDEILVQEVAEQIMEQLTVGMRTGRGW